MNKMIILISIICLLSCNTVEQSEQKDVFPIYNGSCINDYANLISDETEAIIIEQCKNIYDEHIASIVVCTIDTIPKVRKEYNNIMIYATDLFNFWKIGRPGKNDGLLIFISKKDRKVAFNTGYYLETVLHDSSLGRILDNNVIPYFKKEEWGEGILAGIEECRKTILNNL